MGFSPVVNDMKQKVHVHTEGPGLVMQEGSKYGALVKVKVDNMGTSTRCTVQKEERIQAAPSALKTLVPLLQRLPEMTCRYLQITRC